LSFNSLIKSSKTVCMLGLIARVCWGNL